ncbi:MAG: hypothetical protein ACXWC7_14920 [Chitinophagaceae bacterium]
MARSGFDKYKTVDVRYAGQVVGGKSENPKVDSVQLRKNVENLLQQIKKIESEAPFRLPPVEEATKAQPMLVGDTDNNRTLRK